MRELKTLDVFKMSKILKKIDLDINVDGKTATELGGEMLLQIGEKLHLVEKEVNDFMGSLLDMTAEEFSDLPLSKTIKHFEEFKNMPGVEDFFKLAGKQIKK